ncbi:hypothetical protein SAMN05421805_101700 [Saccharopolyspora antimicrobica]|uniref:Uncharacterized protein n=1 Tax=Saccharopolyspora antimicrobica TaxID=455193 RepID=A0A1I4RV18_9PSEU|nr:hypothetical protein SAMN05421805_101700 [Saccharopolyspora antimicrobica]
MCLRSKLICSPVRGSSGRNSRVSRPAPSGSETASSGSASRPSMISIDPPPMSTTSSRPADHPYQLRTAR